MSKTFEYDVFLSYSSKDKETVHALAERLKKDGLRVWLDAWEIRPGDMIGLKIQRGLELSRTLVLCMSPAYFKSEWTTLEHHTLLFRDPTNAQRRFIPFLVENCNPPDIIAQFAYIDWRTPSDEAYSRLLAACRKETIEKAKPAAWAVPVDSVLMIQKGHIKKIRDPYDSEHFDQQLGDLVHPVMEKIKSRGYWKVVIRPSAFVQDRIPELGQCNMLVRDNKVFFRGWDYPHYDMNTESSRGLDYVGQFTDFLIQIEAWRLYQSGQFISYRALWEDWDEARPYNLPQQIQPNEYLSITDTIYLLTEIYEFASRLGAKGILGDSCEIQITLYNTMNRKLASFDSKYLFIGKYKTTLKEIPHSVSLLTTDLTGRSAELSLEHAVWLFQRFSWDNVRLEMLEEDQRKLLERKL